MLTPSPSLTITASESPGIWRILLIILYLVLILVGVYYATRLFAKIAQSGFASPGKKKIAGKSIYLIDRMAFDRDKSIMLIEEGEKRYLLGVTPGGITLLKEYDAPVPQEGEGGEEMGTASFSAVLSNIKKQITGDK